MALPASCSPLESLPNELLDQIISSLATSPPSVTRLSQPPTYRITRGVTRDLKHLSLVSSGLCALVRPHLFVHACFDLKDQDQFFAFIAQADLAQNVSSVVARGGDSPENREDQFWWRRVLCDLDPVRITLVAPPSFIGATLETHIMDGHGWAFEIPLQIVHLERDGRSGDMRGRSPLMEEPSSILSARAWRAFQFNESSSLKAYSHYEYFLFQVPSLFTRWGSLASPPSRPAELPESLSLNRLTTFNYTAVFPFYNHVNLVLSAVCLMTSLQSFSTQLAPSLNDRVIELEQRGSIDPSDPWMELATGYSLIAHAVRDLGTEGCLRIYKACDYQFDALRPELSSILGDILGETQWTHDGQGVWRKVERRPVGIPIHNG